MNIRINYGTAVATVPASALEVMDRATIKDLKVLLTICYDISVLSENSYDECMDVIADRTGLTKNEIEFSLSFWRGTGVIILAENDRTFEATKQVITATQKQHNNAQNEYDGEDRKQIINNGIHEKKKKATHLEYSESELGDWLEAHQDNKSFLDECQNVWRETFGISDHKMIMELIDYLKYDWDYVFVLLAYCEKHFRAQENIGKSLQYVRRQAYSFYDKGITTTAQLQKEIIRLEKVASCEYELRKMFGLENGEIIEKHEKKFSTWLNEYGFETDMIRIAREKAVEATGTSDITAVMNYTNRVLQNWNKQDVRTPQDVELNDIRYNNEKEAKKKTKEKHNKEMGIEGSFNTDDFFAAAVRRSFGDDFDPDKQGT